MGVSTYKQEWERARPLLEAISPTCRRYSNTASSPSSTFNACSTRTRRLPSAPRTEAGDVSANRPRIPMPLQSLFTQGEDGQMRFTAPQQPAGPTPEQIQRLIDQRVNEGLSVQTSRQAIESFVSAKGDNGKPVTRTLNRSGKQWRDYSVASPGPSKRIRSHLSVCRPMPTSTPRSNNRSARQRSRRQAGSTGKVTRA